MSRPAWPYGASLVGGVPQYFSPSALMTADGDSESGCLRKWWFSYVKKIKEPENKAQIIGTELHASIEQYLLTGRREELNALALPGLHMIPEPGPDLGIELDIVGGDLKKAPLRVRGVPIAGFIDLVDHSGVNRGGSDIEDTQDPPGTISITDWKTTSSTRYIKTPKEMADTLQMTTYGKWATTVWPDTEWVRLSHGYFITKGKNTPKKVSLRVHRDQIDKRWKHIDKLAGYLLDVAKESDQNKVPGNARACEAYRGCFYRDQCSFAMHNSLDSLGAPGPTNQDLEDLGYQNVTTEATPVKTSLLSRLKNKSAEATSAATAAVPTEAKKPSAAEIAAEKVRLAMEETLTRWPGLDKVIQKLEALGMGVPKLSGEAAKAYALLGGTQAGTGRLGDLEESFDDPAVMPDLLAEAMVIAGGPVAEPEELPAAVLPPDAPSAKVIAAPPVEATPTADAAIEAAAETPAKKKPGRPKKDPAPIAVAESALVVVTNNVVHEDIGDVAVIRKTDISFYVDCVPSVASESFWTVVNEVTDALAKKYGTDDIRVAPNKDSALAFGGWKGILASALKAAAPKIPPGHYVLDGAQSEVAQVVVETMRDHVRRMGGVFVRGTR